MRLPCVLTIAGSDSSGGAGIQADLKTIGAHLLYGASAICAVTAQNTTGVRDVGQVPAPLVRAQVDAVFDDIEPRSTKVGMLGSAQVAREVARALRERRAANVVVDPVMVATSGARLAGEETVRAMRQDLLPAADVVTPNVPEASALSGMPVGVGATRRERLESMVGAARAIGELTGGAVLVKGGHVADEFACDVLALPDGRALVLRSPRVETSNAHGTGCTLSSAIACELAVGADVVEAVRRAKSYLTDCLRSGLDLGADSGPLDHFARMRPGYAGPSPCEVLEWGR